MRIATWNVNGLRSRLDFVLHWLRARQPDLVGLQELKLTPEQFPREPIEQLGYRIAVHGQKGWNGVAVLSRTPLEVTQQGLPGQEDFGARLLTVSAADLSFTTIYCPNGKQVSHDDFPRKLAWLEALAAHFAERHSPDAPVVLCGDFNVVPAALDSWNEELFHGRIFHTDEERARFRALLDWGFVDLFREKHPDEQKFSWWDYRGGAFHRGQGLRIDLLLGTRALLPRIRSIETDRDYRKKKDGLTASDHAPVIADLE
ncbi:MAG: exodeoxyribonuclease III [bacterium]|nr:exodeoxyribonuclease III [bacterium]